MPFKSEKQRKWMHANKPKMAKKWEKEEESINEMPNFDRGTSGLPRGFIDDYNKIVKKLSKGKGFGTLSRSDKKKVWATLGKKYNESVKEDRDYKAEYKKFQSSTKAKKYRAELNQYNRKKGTYGNNDGKDASHKGGKIVGFEKESTNRGRAEKSRLKKEAISKDEWAQYPKYARKLKPYMQKLLKVPLRVRVIKQANHNPWIEVRVARFGKDIIPNDFRKRALKAIGGGRPRDMDNINYGNITTNSVSMKHDHWVKLLGNKVKSESVTETVKDPKLKVGQKIRHKNDPRKVYTLKKITHGNSGIPEDPAGTSYMFVAPGNRKEHHTKKTWAQAIKKGWIIPESVNEAVIAGSQIVKAPTSKLVKIYKQMADERLSSGAALTFRLIAKELIKRKAKLEGGKDCCDNCIEGKECCSEESVNESTKRQYRDVYSKYYKTYEAFAREVMNLAKRVTKISGDRTDERVILKNFKKQVIPFAGLMRSWSRGRESNPHIDESVDESGILYRAGVKKYGKEGMRKIQQAAGKRKSHAEIGKIKDKYEKGKKESVIVEFSKYRLGGLLDTKLKKRLERTIKVIGGKVDAVGNDYVKFRIGDMALQKLPAVITKLDRNKNVWIGDKNSKNIWDRKRNINKLGEGLHPYKDFNQQDDKKEYDLNLGAFIDKYQKMMKFMKKYKEVPDKNKRAWALSVRKKVGKSRFNGLIDDWGQVVGYLKSFDSFRSKKDDYAWDIKGESIDEGFGSPELMGKKDLAEFEKTRQKNAEVLGYKLTGKSDIKPIKEKTKVTSNK